MGKEKDSNVVSVKSGHNTEIENAVAEGGAYELIRKRLEAQASSLNSNTQILNNDRLSEFGETSLGIIGRVRIRTENNCIARDIVQVNGYLLFGYNVFIGLKTETSISDVFNLYKLNETDEGFSVEATSVTGTFLDDAGFLKEFNELYSYYKNTHLLKLRKTHSRLLAYFQIGEKIDDIRVFRWAIQNNGEISYIDDRGERELKIPPRYDFEWQTISRDDHIAGNHPHISILDEIFIETVGGNLTIKVENNTEDGLGIYQEKVTDKNQSLADATIQYAKLGSIILLKILPYREQNWRYLVFNLLNNQVNRIDALGYACIQLPEDHGIIYPGGYYLASGETKDFGDDASGMYFEQSIKSPNGEDVLYLFYRQDEGKVGLFNYNLIRKELSTPLYGHGFSLFDNGNAILFSSESDSPSRNHPMQIWKTPFTTVEYASQLPQSQSLFGKIGNAELVRAISELYSLVRTIRDQSASALLYENLIKNCEKIFDTYYWFDEDSFKDLAAEVKDIRKTADLVLDEFEKVESIRARANEAIREAVLIQKNLFQEIGRYEWKSPSDFIASLDRIRKHRGHLVTIKELRYIDTDQINELDNALVKEQDRLSKKTVNFLAQDDALIEFTMRVDEFHEHIPTVETVNALAPVREELESMSTGLDMLTELLASLKVEDATVRTKILESISEVYGKLNQTKAHARHHYKKLGSAEAVSEFAAQFTLFSQSITNALGLSTTPEKCDDQLTRLLAQLEELESRFSEHDQFLNDIIGKREEIYESFESHKQALLDDRQRRIHTLSDAADRIIEGIIRRSERFSEPDEINTFFASDPMVAKCRALSQQLREIGDTVRSDDIDSRLKFANDQSVRTQRDKQDIFEDNGKVIKLGKHRFSVNSQSVDLTIVPKNDQLSLHLTGTDYFDVIEDQQLNKLQGYWQQAIVSESESIYRSEYLASIILSAAEEREENIDMAQLTQASTSENSLLLLVKKFVTNRYQEGYEKGIHDHDAVKILQALLNLRERAGLLRYTPKARAFGMLFWARHGNLKSEEGKYLWKFRSESADLLSKSLQHSSAYLKIRDELLTKMQDYFNKFNMSGSTLDYRQAAEYLSYELKEQKILFKCSQYGMDLVSGLEKHLQTINHLTKYQKLLSDLDNELDKQWALAESWLEGFLLFSKQPNLQRFIPEAVAILLTQNSVKIEKKNVELIVTVTGLMGEHPLISEQSIIVALDEFTNRLQHHRHLVVPEFYSFIQHRQDIIERERDLLRLDDYKPSPLSSFVRNRLISEVYLPLIGDNLAKQMGTVGKNKRTDLMGLLLLISPPGYGKTTLMEYVANRMGLIFVKINCPSLGHDVQSLDPQQAPNATARQEIEKINLALEMGNNVMLYLDDIQHTHPEFLQKFISLCDGSRRIEGVWKGESKTYDLRGKKYCVIMAGNPYTESGETFKIPDMLANRADIYNLGDVLSGREKQFSMSYIENCLTANAILAPLASRNMEDVYKFIRMAEGENIATTDIEHNYSGAEVNEIVDILKKLFKVRDTVLKVNQHYIISAAQDDKYRIEPPFKLQGSYRNMSKMAEKVSAIMNDKELNNLIRDHYLGEAQTLTTGAEQNLLKLGELNNSLNNEEATRWTQIKQDYARMQGLGGDDIDPATKLANQIAKISQNLNGIQDVLTLNTTSEPIQFVANELEHIGKSLEKAQINVEVVNQPVPGMDKVLHVMGDAITTSLLPVVSAMEHKLKMDHDIWERVKELGEDISNLQKSIVSSTTIKKPIIKPHSKPGNNK